MKMILNHWILWSCLATAASAFLSTKSPLRTHLVPVFGTNPDASHHQEIDDESVLDPSRRILWTTGTTGLLGLSSLTLAVPPALATSSKSRTEGYAIQQSESAWKAQLSPLQYEILREGGTERPGFSVLESEKRPGIFRCAGCDTPLFDARDKFNSGTGWPSFARALPGVEIEPMNPLMASVSGAELRCATCGGHLGDVFRDGFLFVGTEAAKTNQRFCIDGAALVFYPDKAGEPPVSGDRAQAKKTEMPSWLEPPKITPQQ